MISKFITSGLNSVDVDIPQAFEVFRVSFVIGIGPGTPCRDRRMLTHAPDWKTKCPPPFPYKSFHPILSHHNSGAVRFPGPLLRSNVVQLALSGKLEEDSQVRLSSLVRHFFVSPLIYFHKLNPSAYHLFAS